MRKLIKDSVIHSTNFVDFVHLYGDLGVQLCCDVGFNIRIDDLDHYDEKMFEEVIAEYEKLESLAKTLKSNIEAIGQKYNYKKV